MTPNPDTRFDLLRHGETQGGARFCGSTEVLLTARGWRQMWAAVAAAEPWDGIVTSPLSRCADFARILAERLALPCSIDERWRELHFGAWEGRDSASLYAADPEALTNFWRNPVACPPPQGESLPKLQARVLAAWHDLIRDHTGQRLLVISHGGPLRVILGHIKGLSPEQLLSIEVPYAGFYRIPIDRDHRYHWQSPIPLSNR